MVEALTVYNNIVAPPIAKGKTVHLLLSWYVHDYKVISVSNTTYLKPGMWLTPVAAEKCCQLEGWEVTIVDNEVLGTVVGAVAGRITQGIATADL
jgi:hypothetical protein